jgi:hypothetical protein
MKIDPPEAQTSNGKEPQHKHGGSNRNRESAEGRQPDKTTLATLLTRRLDELIWQLVP